jgi:hypothetical protein
MELFENIFCVIICSKKSETNRKVSIMAESRNTIDMSSLPEHAKNELSDFYEFLSQKYGVKEKSETPGPHMKKFLSEPISVGKIMRFNREELHERR